MKIVITLIILGLIAGLCYVGFQMQRKWNYYWSYETMVKQSVCDMVKPEYLIKPCK